MEQQVMGQSKVWDHKSWLQEGLARRADLMAEKARLEEVLGETSVKIAEIDKVLEAMESLQPEPEPKRIVGTTAAVRAAVDRLFVSKVHGPVTENEIATESQLPRAHIQSAMVRLTAAGEVVRSGQRGAWLYSRPAPVPPLGQTPNAKILRALCEGKTKSLTESEASWAVDGDLNLAKVTLQEMVEQNILEEEREDRGTGDGERVWILVDRRSY